MADNPNTDTSIQETGGTPVLHMRVSSSQNVQTPVDKTLSISEMAADAKATGDAINNLGNALEEEIAELAADVIPNSHIDDTLMQEGYVAEAKAVGDAINNILEAISSLTNMTYPVGSIYMTTQESVPNTFDGTWVEIAIPVTWNDLKKGVRSYAALPETQPERTIHFFLRVE